MGFEIAEDAAERARFFADAGSSPEIAAGTRGRCRRVPATCSCLGDAVANLRHVRTQPRGRGVGLALPRAADVDAGIRLDRQPVAELGERFVREAGLEEHVRTSGQWSVVGGQWYTGRQFMLHWCFNSSCMRVIAARRES